MQIDTLRMHSSCIAMHVHMQCSIAYMHCLIGAMNTCIHTYHIITICILEICCFVHACNLALCACGGRSLCMLAAHYISMSETAVIILYCTSFASDTCNFSCMHATNTCKSIYMLATWCTFGRGLW